MTELDYVVDLAPAVDLALIVPWPPNSASPTLGSRKHFYAHGDPGTVLYDFIHEQLRVLRQIPNLRAANGDVYFVTAERVVPDDAYLRRVRSE